MLLILSNKKDVHTDIIIDKLHKLELPFLRWNLEDFAQSHIIDVEICNGKTTKMLLNAEQRSLDLHKNISVVWYRRPGEINFPENITDPNMIDFSAREIDFLKDNLWQLLGDKTWINDPHNNKRMNSKLYQLKLASEVGLFTPPTLVTNNPESVLLFVKQHGEIITKAISSGYIKNSKGGFDNIYTHKITSQDLNNIDAIKITPTLFQAYIPKKIELRVTVIEESVFSCAIESQKSAKTQIDWRQYDFDNVPHYIYSLPPIIEQKLIKFLKIAGLKFGAFDLILTPDNEYFFVEVNSNGQWYWIEHLTGLKITDRLVELFAQQG